MMDIDSWFEPPADPPFYCCDTATWSWHEGEMYCESCGADIPLPSGPQLDNHVRARRGEPLVIVPPQPPPPRPPAHPENCPGCDEPVADSRWDADYRLCTACVQESEAAQALAEDEYRGSLEEDFDGSDCELDDFGADEYRTTLLEEQNADFDQE